MEIMPVIRHVGQFVAGFFVSKGLIEGSMEEVVAGGVVGIIALAWYWFTKKNPVEPKVG